MKDLATLTTVYIKTPAWILSDGSGDQGKEEDTVPTVLLQGEVETTIWGAYGISKEFSHTVLETGGL